jgi:hypothetical protein
VIFWRGKHLDRSEVGEFLTGFIIYILVFITILFALSRIKRKKDRASVSGAVCFGLLAAPWMFYSLIIIALAGSQVIQACIIVIVVFIIEAGIGAFYGYSISTNKKILIILAALMIFIFVFGLTYILFFRYYDWRIGIKNSGVIWEKIIGKSNDESAECIIETTGGDFILAADTWSSENRSDILLVKISGEGRIIWEKNLGGTDIDRVHRIVLTGDNGYIIIGETRSYGAGGEDVWLVKTDSNGDIQWSKTFGGPHNETGEDIEITPDGGYIIASKTWTKDNEILEAWVIKTDFEGNKLWSKTYQADKGRWCKAKDIALTTDNGYVLVGDAWSSESGTPESYERIWIRKLNSEGSEDWYREYHSSEYGDTAIGVQQVSDNGYIIAGNIEDNEKHFRLIWLIKVSSDGEEIWNNKYGEPENNYFNNIILTNDGNLLVTGYHTPDWPEYDYIVMGIDIGGNELWEKKLNKLKEDEGTYSIQTDDGNYVVIGNIANGSGSYPINQDNIWIVKYSK